MVRRIDLDRLFSVSGEVLPELPREPITQVDPQRGVAGSHRDDVALGLAFEGFPIGWPIWFVFTRVFALWKNHYLLEVPEKFLEPRLIIETSYIHYISIIITLLMNAFNC